MGLVRGSGQEFLGVKIAADGKSGLFPLTTGHLLERNHGWSKLQIITSPGSPRCYTLLYKDVTG